MSLFSVSALALATSAQGGTTWDGGDIDNYWNYNNNWDPNGSPTPGSSVSLTFAGSTRLNSINNYTGFQPWQSILFSSGAGSFNITSTSGANWDLYYKIENNSTNAQSVSIDAISLKSSINGNEFDPTNGDLSITAKDIYTNGSILNVYGTKTLTINNSGGAGIQQGGGIVLQTGFTGTVVLNGSNSFTGATTVNGGKLTAGATNSLGGTSGITVNSGGTLLLSGATSDRINNSATVTLNAGSKLTIGSGLGEGVAGGSAGIGALTLAGTSGSHVTIDFGSGTGSTLLFSSLAAGANAYVDILNWTGLAGFDNGSASNDRFLFVSDPGLTQAQLANFAFYDDSNTAYAIGATIFQYGGQFELVPVPEPSTWAAAALALGAIAWTQRRRLTVAKRSSVLPS